MEFYLRVEAVNLDHFVYDTGDLSTVRGGSLLLREAVTRRFLPGDRLTPISVGASAGLFRFTAADQAEAQSLRAAVLDHFRNDSALTHATFVADVVEPSCDFVADCESLRTKNRVRQLQQPSLVLPSVAQDARAACYHDQVRPGVRSGRHGDKPVMLSESTWQRREFGRKGRQQFYHDELLEEWPLQCDFSVVDTLEELTDDLSQDLLHQRMAIIYTDGNGFGQIQRQNCRDEDTQRRFDSYITGCRRTLLRSLLQQIHGKPAWQHRAADGTVSHRIETLLWGGDEILWVVPAWQGIAVLQHFFAQTSTWNIFSTDLRHAAGLVFCRYNTPIGRMKRLAERLAEKAKNAGRDRDRLAYQILDAFDDGDAAHGEALEAGDLLSLAEVIASLKRNEDLPRGRLRQLAGEARRGDSIDERAITPEVSAQVARLDHLGPNRWLHLDALWDYAPTLTQERG